jgi:hypothetical protein
LCARGCKIRAIPNDMDEVLRVGTIFAVRWEVGEEAGSVTDDKRIPCYKPEQGALDVVGKGGGAAGGFGSEVRLGPRVIGTPRVGPLFQHRGLGFRPLVED